MMQVRVHYRVQWCSAAHMQANPSRDSLSFAVSDLSREVKACSDRIITISHEHRCGVQSGKVLPAACDVGRHI